MKIKHNRMKGFTLVEIMIVVAIIGLLATIAIPNFVHARQQANRTACIVNLRQIDSAKQTWGMENRAGQNTLPTPANIQPYIGRGTGGSLPICPSDSQNSFATSYEIQDLSTTPTCKILPGAPGDVIGHRLDP